MTQWNKVFSSAEIPPDATVSRRPRLDEEYVFRLDKKEEKVAAILVLRYASYDPYNCVLFASSLEFGVVFDAYMYPAPMVDDFLQPRRHFQPHKHGSGVQLDLGTTQVNVVAEFQYEDGLDLSETSQLRRKCYTAHISIW